MKYNTVISDIHEISRCWKYLIDKEGRYNVIAYATSRNNAPKKLDDVVVIDYEQLSILYEKKAVQKIVIPRERFVDQSMLISDLERHGVDRRDVLLTGKLWQGTSSIEEYDGAAYLPYLEIHVADQCNLNCKGCEHYSGLVNKAIFHSPERIKADLQRLHSLIDDIYRIRILGGEPLLNEKICTIMMYVREVYPESDINIVTNGLLLKNMNDNFFDTCRENNVSLYISYYPPMIGKMEDLRSFLDDKCVRYTITSLMSTFRIKYTMEKQSDVEGIFRSCAQAHCYNLYDGKIAACFLPFTTKYFNEYFEKKLPEDGAVNIYDDYLTTKTLKQKLQTPFERCSFCKMHYKTISWDTICKPNQLSDWVYDLQ